MKHISQQPVISGARYFLAHTPGLVRYGSKPSREISKQPSLLESISAHLRPYHVAAAYPPNRVFLGAMPCERLRSMDKPWFNRNEEVERWGPHGELMPEEEFYGLLKICDAFELVWLEQGFTRQVKKALQKHPLVEEFDLKRFGEGRPYSEIEAASREPVHALPLYLQDGTIVGCVCRAHDEDSTLAADVLLENLSCKATATMAMRTLLHEQKHVPSTIDYVINTGEEAVGDRYQRGGGNLAKAVAEMCGCFMATGIDVKGFCCGPLHGLAMAGSLVHSSVFNKVVVTGGCSLPKLGMKFLGHLKNDMPILEDVLAGIAIMIEQDNGRSPVMRLDSIGRHTVDASSQQVIFEQLVSAPLQQLGLRFQDVDKYATELHNPEVTEPAGSGNVPELNYRIIASLATLAGEIDRSDITRFIHRHGLPGFSPTQGHIASAVPFMGQAVDRLTSGQMVRTMFLAKGSLFLGRMTQLADGLSFILERNKKKS